MKFDGSTFENKEELREKILECYGRDIAEGSCHFSSRNYAFVISEGSYPVAIRVSVNSGKDRKDVVSELMWVDDLRRELPTISQAVPSLYNHIAEDFEIGGVKYCVTMFRKANGDVLAPKYWNPEYFKETGRVLGQIHRTGKEGYELGFRYKRCQWYEKKSFDFECLENYLGASAREKAQAIYDEVRALPQTPEVYGMIHGDYQSGNLFVDWDKVWVFDFDDCCYGYYMQDVAEAMQLFLLEGRYRGNEERREVFYGKDGIFTLFKEGYEEYNHLPESHWEKIGLFFKLRTVETSIITIQSNVMGEDMMRGLLTGLADFYDRDKDFIDTAQALLGKKKKSGLTVDDYRGY